MEIQEYKSKNDSYSVTVLETLSKIVSAVSTKALEPLKGILTKLVSDEKGVTGKAKDALNLFWSSTTKSHRKPIFDISSVWKRDGGLAKTYCSSSFSSDEKSWDRFIVAHVGSSAELTSCAIGIEYIQSIYELAQWEKTLEDFLKENKPDYGKSLRNEHVFL